MKIGFVLPDGVGVRNYLYSKLINLINKKHEIFVISTLTNKSAVQEISDEMGCDILFHPLPKYSEKAVVKFLRESATYARLIKSREFQNNPALMNYWMPKRDSFSKGLFFNLVELVGRWASLDPRSIIKLDERQAASLRKGACYRECKTLLEEITPEVLLCTHQRAINAVPLFLAAKDKEIRTVSAIYSWDNLPKARLLMKADEYLVWSNYMKEELETYYPEESHKPIHITGTPQFEFYSDESNYCSREGFCREFDLDPARKIICYSGGDTLTSPYDQCYVADLAEEIMSMSDADRPQLLLRRCPIDFSARYDETISKYSDIIRVSIPKWRQGDSSTWTLTYPLYDDVKLLVNTVRHCDAVYNVGSTMAHDFFTHGKPAIYANYDPPEAADSGWSTETIYQFQHFRSMPSKKCVEWVNSQEGILPVLNRVLGESYQPSPESRLWLDKIAGPTPENASQRILKVLTQ